MCGKYRQTATAQRLQELFGITADFSITPHDKITPGMVATVVTQTGFALKTWGLTTPWAKDNKIIVNARGETLHEKPSFKNAARCLVPATGFFESNIHTRPFDIHLADDVPFALAGVYTDDRFCLVTTAANDDMITIHDRMPVILSGTGMFTGWLAGMPVSGLDKPPHLVATEILTRQINLF